MIRDFSQWPIAAVGLEVEQEVAQVVSVRASWGFAGSAAWKTSAVSERKGKQ